MGEHDWHSSGSRGQDRLGKVRLVFARIFGDGENPLAWGFPLFRLSGIRVRIHLLFLIYLLVELIFTLPGNRDGLVFVLPRLVAIVALVVLRELAHAAAVRRLGGRVEELMLWPMGGLSPLDVPENPGAQIRAALAGPVVHLILFPIFAGLMYWQTRDAGGLLINPLLFGGGAVPVGPDGHTTWLMLLIQAFYGVNLSLLLLNLLLPMFPLDGASVAYGILLKKSDPLRAQRTAINIGLGTATAVGLVGLVMEDGTALFSMAVVCGLVCSIMRRRLQFLAYAEPIVAGGVPMPPIVDDDDEEVMSREELDRILTKISESGMGSLSRRERRSLKRATESSRKT